MILCSKIFLIVILCFGKNSRCDFALENFLILTLCQKIVLSVNFQMTSSVVDEADGVSIVALILPICASLVGWGMKTFEYLLRD